jgi:hypothetical protein
MSIKYVENYKDKYTLLPSEENRGILPEWKK